MPLTDLKTRSGVMLKAHVEDRSVEGSMRIGEEVDGVVTTTES